jgi:hypothetical protein
MCYFHHLHAFSSSTFSLDKYHPVSRNSLITGLHELHGGVSWKEEDVFFQNEGTLVFSYVHGTASSSTAERSIASNKATSTRLCESIPTLRSFASLKSFTVVCCTAVGTEKEKTAS